MLKNILLLALVSCALLVSTQALTDFHDRLKDRVIHIETLIDRGRWLWQNDNRDADGSYYLYMDELAKRDTYYTPTVQYQTTVCGGGKYLCLESLSLRDYYLAAGYPPDGPKHTVKLQKSVYTEDDNRYHWKFLCQDETLENCKVVPIRFESDGYFMVADDWGGGGHDGGHYDATLGKDESTGYFLVHAPNPTDGFIEIYHNSNTGTNEHAGQYQTKVGVSQTHETGQTITSSTSVEIGGAFKAFSASASSTIDSSWQATDSTTFEASKTVTHDLMLPPKTKVTLLQLIGNYDDAFDVGDDSYEIREDPLDGGPTSSRRVKYLPVKAKQQKVKSGKSPCSFCKLLKELALKCK